ncbi:glycosyltransferase family 4 protein [Allocoleopsis franciscana]|uniref:Glycosyltransferase n=1 Tax=Allocoleopsis franciscana PCC 7113 TaxID=1173027 RepID=K9WF84_9CYAN|nr:glycosyltransferase family 4 protein [Allocoleopsis franciscana]AFZ18434.1 glycosyltransferase [Allocoleopsis franciscana PCC 7113]
MTKRLRILYAAGPGDVVGTYHYWVTGQDDPSQVSITYSSQFYEVCREMDAESYVISSSSQRKFYDDGQFKIQHRPIPFLSSSALFYHLGQVWNGLRLIASAIRFRANVAVVADGTAHWFVLSLLSWLGVQVIPSIHCGLWRKYVAPSKVQRLFLNLSRPFLSRDCAAILTVSDEIAAQVTQLTESKNKLVRRFTPIYRREEFAEITPPSERHLPFRVLYVGRIEENKGVLDLLEMAKHLAAQGRKDITFDLCGNGSMLESLRHAAKLAGVEARFVCHGHCNKQKMRRMFNRSHAVIVPTKTGFAEGFNKVVAEGILSARPVITSAVCPALSYVRDAVVEVPPDDIMGYSNALLKLCDDRQFYEQKHQSCLGLQEQFYDQSKSWGGALKSILESIQERRELKKDLKVERSLG